MNSKTLLIYEYQILYKILSEIKEYLDFEVLDINKKNFQKLELSKFEISGSAPYKPQNIPTYSGIFSISKLL